MFLGSDSSSSLWDIKQIVFCIEFLCDLVHLSDNRQRLPEHGDNLIRGTDVHDFEECQPPRQHAERQSRSLTDHPRVELGQRLVVRLCTHGGSLSVLLAGAQALQKQLQPPQSAVEPQQSAAARLWVAARLLQVHQLVLQLVFHHGLHGEIFGAAFTVQKVSQDLDLAAGVLGDEAEDVPQAVQKPVEEKQTWLQFLSWKSKLIRNYSTQIIIFCGTSNPT